MAYSHGRTISFREGRWKLSKFQHPHQDAQLAQHVTKVHSAFEKKETAETAETTGVMLKKI